MDWFATEDNKISQRYLFKLLSDSIQTNNYFTIYLKTKTNGHAV